MSKSSGPLRDYWFEAVYLKGGKQTTMMGLDEALKPVHVINELIADRERGVLVCARVWEIDEDGKQSTQPVAVTGAAGQFRDPQSWIAPPAKPNTSVRKEVTTVVKKSEPNPLDLEHATWAYDAGLKSNTYPTVRFNEEKDHGYNGWY